MRRSSTRTLRNPATVLRKTDRHRHQQVHALDQTEAEIAREISVLEIGLVDRPGRQEADARVLDLASRASVRAQRVEERRQPLHVEAAEYDPGSARDSAIRFSSAYPAPEGACARSRSTHHCPVGLRPMSTA